MTRLPFTPEQFFQVFAMYNGQFRVAVALWWLVSLGVIAAAWWKPSRFSRLLTCVLSGLWVWNAVAYHASLFTRINPVAWVFAALFLIQAVLLWAVVPRSLEYFSSRGPMSGIGLGLVVYSFLYPFLNTLGHAYPATPTFGVPCPTTILTIGVLLTVRGGAPAACSIIPVLWAIIGGSAAVLLAVATDYVLLGAGLLLMAVVVKERVRFAFPCAGTH
jgi:hypothetical protein